MSSQNGCLSETFFLWKISCYIGTCVIPKNFCLKTLYNNLKIG